jgi:uncharacterized protein (TIGR03437 family)
MNRPAQTTSNMTAIRIILLLCLTVSAVWSEITALEPASVTAGSATFTLRAFGDYLLPGETLAFNGRPLNTTYVSYNEVRATIPAELVRTAGRFEVSLIGYNSLPFLVNSPPVITSASPLPQGTTQAIYSTTLTYVGGTMPVRWSVIAGQLPPGLSLSQDTGILHGTPSNSGTSTFTVRLEDFSKITTTRTLTLKIGNGPAAPPSCEISPRNMLLPMHRPEFHIGAPTQFPDHIVRVNVSGAATGISVTLNASQLLFPDRTGQPASTAQTSITDSSGSASFTVNPVAGGSFTLTELTATGRRGTEAFLCSGSIVVCAGALTAVSQNILAPPTSALNVLQHRFGADYERFAEEIIALAQQYRGIEVEAGKAFSEFEPILQQALRGEQVNLASRDLARIDGVIRRIEQLASPDLQRGLARWRQDLRHAPMKTSIASASAPPQAATTIQARSPLPGTLLSFEPNLGQLGAGIHFASRGAGHSALLTDSGMTLVTPTAATIQLKFAGVRKLPLPKPLAPTATRSHYLLGGHPQRWLRDVPHYGRLEYSDIYPKTDLVFYGDDGRLRYDFVLHPGSRPSRIALNFDGVLDLESLDTGELLLHHLGGATRLGKPFVYQSIGGKQVEVAARYQLRGHNKVGFEIGPYDKERDLVIDPVLTYATFSGGSRDDAGLAIAVDSQGNAYMAGVTASADFPAARALIAGRPAPSANNTDIFVTKLTPDGKGVVYTTYFGGSGIDVPSSIALDAGGNVFVAGSTYSPNFPIVGGVQSTYGGGRLESGGDGFVAKLNAAGSTLLYSTYLGGSGGEAIKAIAVDSEGNAFLAGYTASANFPLRSPIQAALRGGIFSGTDAFAAKLNAAGNALVYSTFLGGSGDDLATGLALDSTGHLYLAGVTYSANFPMRNPMQNANAGAADAFLTKLTPAGDALAFSTYYGGEADDFATSIAVDRTGNAYLAGTTGSTQLPVLSATQPKPGSVSGLGFDGFLAKLDSSGSSLVYATYIGGSGMDMVHAVAVGEDNAPYLVGETDSTDFPVKDSVRAAGALSDGFLLKLAPSGLAVDYASYLGGQGLDVSTAVALDRTGSAYIAGSSTSRDYPVTIGSAQSRIGGRTDAYVLKISPGISAPQLSLLSAASLQRGGAVAPSSLVTAFGTALAPRLEVASSPTLPTTLAGVTVSVRDALGVSHLAPLIFVSPTQINFLIPAATALGVGEISVRNEMANIPSGAVRVDAVAPALFAANANGAGAPAAIAIRVDASGNQSPLSVFQCGALAGSCQPATIAPAAPGEDLYLTLFGTGLRGRSNLSRVRLTIGGIEVPIAFAGAQPEFEGLDQINAGPLPRSLAGKGTVALQLFVDGEQANTLELKFQ